MKPENRNSLLCPNCRKLISADETRCPYCGIHRPGAWYLNNPLMRVLADGERLIRAVIAVNAGFFLISLLFNPAAATLSMNPLRLLSPASNSLLLLGATGTLPIDGLHRWWSLVTASYLHGGMLHILFNMLVFSRIAPLVVREYGSYRMFVIYTASGISGFFVSYLAGISLTIGASAAVCGLIGAMLYFGRSRGGTYGRLIYRQLGGWALGIFIFGLLVPGINNWGHGGGIIGGALVGLLMSYRERKPENAFHKLLSAGCAGMTMVVLCWSLVSAVFQRLG